MRQISVWAITVAFVIIPCVLISKEIMKTEHVYFVVMAGGNGDRLWPLSRKHCPKQLLAIDAKKTLLEQSLDRVRPLTESNEQLWVVTTENHTKAVKEVVGDSVGHILVEPGARNTGPAILYSCLVLSHIAPDAVVVFLPADPFIPPSDSEKFTACLQRAVHFAKAHASIALLGVKPLYPATGYGYIEYDTTITDSKTDLFKVKTFHEKPSHSLAQSYVQQSSMLWNIGMFCGRVSVFIDEFKRAAPELFDCVKKYREQKKAYHEVPSISVDYAVMERSNNVWVVPADFTWCDVGNIGIFLSLKQEHQGVGNNLIQVDSRNNLVDVPGKLVALVGVDDLCVVQTENALLITKRDEAEKVKSVVTHLRKENMNEYL